MMGGKFLEKRITIDLGEENKKPDCFFELEYYLLESEINESEKEESRKVYGIEIVKKLQEESVEIQRYDDICFTREKTRGLIELLAKNAVTPVTLPYILDDMLGA